MLYRIAKSIAYPFFHSYIRLDVIGHENVPKSGGVLLAPNHISYLDPILVGVATKRKVYSMAKGELFRNTFFRYFMRNLNAFPVRRGTIDRNALKRSLQVLDEGNVLVIFPEGTIPLAGETKEGKQGVAWLVLKTNVPVVPIKITGSSKLLPDGKVFPKMGRAKLVFGQPIRFDLKDKNHKGNKRIITEKIIKEIEGLGSDLTTSTGKGNK
jgi:1-acyl-sn-glycerol-3-phosphate acyltransferase